MTPLTDRMRKIKVSDLMPYLNNSKIHPRKQVDALRQSIEQNDYIQPIVIGKDNVIVMGHGRYQALSEMNPDEEIDVVDVSHMSEEQVRKLRILDNRLVSEDYDMEKLTAEIDGIYNGLDDIDRIADDLNITAAELGVVEVEDYSDLDQSVEEGDGLDTANIIIELPKKYRDQVMEYLANGNQQTARGMGKGIIQRCELV